MLSFFTTKNIKYSRCINGIANSTFAVLLIHDDPLVRKIVWTRIFNNASFGTSEYLWLHAFITIVSIYTFCILVDKIYVYGIKSAFQKFKYKKNKK